MSNSRLSPVTIFPQTDISALCHKTDCVLWDAYRQGTVSGSNRLIFPKLRDGNRRISEQEARFAFVEALHTTSLKYSIETPTDKEYSFSNNGSRSAMTDLSIYHQQGKNVCNVEFKSRGKSAKANDLEPIRKDLEKLFREKTWGLWFHVLESVNSKTLSNLLEVLAKQSCCVRGLKSDIESYGLTIHICVLKHGFSVQKNLPIDFSPAEMKVDLFVSRDSLKSVRDLNGWRLHEEVECIHSDGYHAG